MDVLCSCNWFVIFQQLLAVSYSIQLFPILSLFPLSPENSDYIHRAGRVGRVGTKHRRRLPMVYSLVSHKWEVEVLWTLERAVRKAEILPDVDANIKKHHEERHEEKKALRQSETMEDDHEEKEEKASKKSRQRNVSTSRPRPPGSRRLKNIPVNSYEY